MVACDDRGCHDGRRQGEQYAGPTIGGSVGSAASAAALTAHTSSVSPFPLDGGCTEAAMIGVAVLVLATVVAWQSRSLSVSGAAMGAPKEFVAESVDAEVAGVIVYEMDADPDEVGR